MTTSNVILPLEILEEFILQDPSPASLAGWCLAGSHELSSFAGRLLYEKVALEQADDIVPFLTRLCVPTAPDEPAPLSPIHLLRALEIRTLPGREDIVSLWARPDRVLRTGTLSLHLRWPETTAEGGEADRDALGAMDGFFAPCLLLVLNPTEYAEIRRFEGEDTDPGQQVSPKIFPSEIHQTYLTVLEGENASDGPVWLKQAYHGCSDAAKHDRVIPLEQAARRNKVASFLVTFKAAGVLPTDVCPSFETHNATIDQRYVPYRAPDAIATDSLWDFAIHIHQHCLQTAAQAIEQAEALETLSEDVAAWTSRCLAEAEAELAAAVRRRDMFEAGIDADEL